MTPYLALGLFKENRATFFLILSRSAEGVMVNDLKPCPILPSHVSICPES
jgi:hypothetical protein